MEDKYNHLNLDELKADLVRCQEQHKTGDFMSDEISELRAEIQDRNSTESEIKNNDLRQEQHEEEELIKEILELQRRKLHGLDINELKMVIEEFKK